MIPSDPYEATPAVISDQPNPEQERKTIAPSPIRFTAIVKTTFRAWRRGFGVAFLLQAFVFGLDEVLNRLPIMAVADTFEAVVEQPWVFGWWAFEFLLYAAAMAANLAYLGHLTSEDEQRTRWRHALDFRWRDIAGIFAVDLFLLLMLVASFALVALALNLQALFAAFAIVLALGVSAYVWSALIAARPLMVVERRSIPEALRLSHRLTSGQRVPIAVVAVFFVAAFYALVIVTPVVSEYTLELTSIGGVGASVLEGSIQAVLQALASTVLAAFYITAYRALRAANPGKSA